MSYNKRHAAHAVLHAKYSLLAESRLSLFNIVVLRLWVGGCGFFSREELMLTEEGGNPLSPKK
jgi:hypothetical protein